LLDLLGVEPGRISGSLARLLAVLAVIAPYTQAAQLAWLLLGVKISPPERVFPMGVWKVVQRLGESAARYSDALSHYHADSRSEGAPTQDAPAAPEPEGSLTGLRRVFHVVLSVDACFLGMQVRTQRRRRKGCEPPGTRRVVNGSSTGVPLPPLPPVAEGQFRDVKTGVLLLPSERVETSPGRRSVVRRFLVSCLGNADAIFSRLYAQLRELGCGTHVEDPSTTLRVPWVGAHTVVVIVGDGAEWIWNRATLFVNRCEILDFWHALEHAWAFAQLCYAERPFRGEGSQQADRWVHGTRRVVDGSSTCVSHPIAEDLKAGKVQEVIARRKRMRPKTPEMREKLQSLIRYYSDNAARMHYDEYLRLGYGIGSGAVESAHKQVVHARFRQAGMRWSEAGARRLLALRLLVLNENWALLDRLAMVSVA